MDRALSFREARNPTLLKHSVSLKRSRSLKNSNPFSAFSSWVSISLKKFNTQIAKSATRVDRSRSCFEFNGTVTFNSVYCASPAVLEIKMESFLEKSEEIEERGDGLVENEEECREFSSNSRFVSAEVNVNEGRTSSEGSTSPPSMVHSESPHISDDLQKPQKLEKQASSLSEIDLMKERFAKLLLGEDMSGCGNGVCTALAISNAITNLCATIFGQIWRLEPLPVEKKVMWRREMDCILSLSAHIVELMPSWQIFTDGSKIEVMTTRPRSDLYANLPALKKLDNMLLETLDSFDNVDFWYVDQGIITPEANASSSSRELPNQEDKWWLPVPRVPTNGLSEDARKDLQHRRDSTNQILKAALAINSNMLAEMDIPDSYLEGLPKNAKASLGDLIHRYISSDQFSPDCLLECVDLSSEHQALEIANRVEASIYIWRRRTNSKPLITTNRSSSKSSWEMVKDLVKDADKREELGDRAESLLLCLKQRFPGLPQTTLDMSKIQFNKDVGKSILESYSRVLESLSFNIIARIDDLLYVDDLTKNSDQSVPVSNVGITAACKSVGIPLTAPVIGTPYKTAYSTPTFSPAKKTSPAKEGKSQSPETKSSQRGLGMKKILTDYLMADSKVKSSSKQMRRLSLSSRREENSASQSTRSSDWSKEANSTETHDTEGKDDTRSP